MSKRRTSCSVRRTAKGSAAAAYALSVLVLKDVKKKKEEEAKAKSEEYRKFALDRKYPPALYELALGKEGRERAELLNEAAERDYIPAIVRYAKELEEEFPDRAFALWQRAYALGSLRGAYGMGRCYERGIGVPANREKAYVSLYRQAAKSGYADAIAVVGMYYQKGCVVDMDAKLAEECYDVGDTQGQHLCVAPYGEDVRDRRQGQKGRRRQTAERSRSATKRRCSGLPRHIA